MSSFFKNPFVNLKELLAAPNDGISEVVFPP